MISVLGKGLSAVKIIFKGNAKKDSKGLTPKQSIFVAEYLRNPNATQAIRERLEG
jgi:hypothetical protein